MKKVPPRSHGKRRAKASFSRVSRRLVLPAERFLHSETVSGAVLFAMSALALAWANSPWQTSYFELRELPIWLGAGPFGIRHSLQEWVNDGLMVLFFFVVALEVKRELLCGELSEKRKAILPVAAALGGMLVPAALFWACNAGSPTARGWGIPMATDIAFAVAALALLGPTVPLVLRVFLLSYAIVDDIGAILVIALFYSGSISWPPLGLALALLAVMALVHRLGASEMSLYWVLGILVWAATLQSGVHSTIAGVILGALAPATAPAGREQFLDQVSERGKQIRDFLSRGDAGQSDELLGELEELARQTEPPLERLERTVHPWVSFAVLPLFALLNAGVDVSADLLRSSLSSPLALGIALGLLIGKPLGILAATWACVRLRLASLPAQITWRHLAGVGFLGGIGFTVALFIAGLAFHEPREIAEATVAILAVSAAAMGIGCLILLPRRRQQP